MKFSDFLWYAGEPSTDQAVVLLKLLIPAKSGKEF
jgi:hypothetical protein